MRLLLGSLACVLLLTPVASRQLTAIRVSAGDDLQAAIDAARPGDTILLHAGAEFTGNFTLPHHPDARGFITLRTDAPGLPGEGVRTGPEHAGRLAVIRSPNADAALRTAPGAHHWRLENLAFRANRQGHGNIIELGSGGQRERAAVPHTLVLDRLYITGDPALGQKRAIALNSGATEIRNCYVADIKGVGMDTQAIAGWNGPGPYRIENNYLEAAGENLMFGGGDPAIPDLVPEDIVIRRNVLSKPEAWRDPIVAIPAGLRALPAAGGGTVPAGDYIYTVVAERPAGQGVTAVSAVSEPAPAALAAEGAVALEWQPVGGASGYRVYRRDAAGAFTMWPSEAPAFRDTGEPGTNAKPPSQPTTWTVKNLFELKNARQVVFDGNRLERNWLAAQTGYAILLQAVNQDGRAPWSTVEHVRIVNNVIRHVSAAINILGVDQRRESGRVAHVTIANNLFLDVDRRWGGTGDFLLIGGGAADVTVEHNTVQHSGRVIAAYGGSKEPKQMARFVFRNNLMRHNEYGVKGDGVNTGRPTLERYFPDATFEGNVLAGGPRGQYPPGNHFPSVTELEAQFVDARAGNFRVKPGSRLHGLGADLEQLDDVPAPP